ncbi:MAG: thioredoxin domain-containing protein [Patescibacteria group bacterium]
MDTQKRVIIWVSSLLIVGITIVAVWQIATGEKPARVTTGTLSEQVGSDEWTKGASLPTVSLVEYSDFQCPACGYYHSVVEEVLKENEGNLTFTYRHFPLPQHKNALAAAYASEAAGTQGKFWEMHRLIFEHQNDWSDSTTAESIFEGYATELKLDIAKFKSDRDSQATKDAVEHDKETGLKSGISSTPTFYLNGKKMANPKSPDEFKALIKSAVAESNG